MLHGETFLKQNRAIITTARNFSDPEFLNYSCVCGEQDTAVNAETKIIVAIA